MRGQNPTHLGDGCYVEWNRQNDGGITFMANDHKSPTDTVHLEPYVIEAFFDWYKALIEETNNPSAGVGGATR